ncbi:MAG: hypothetical protein JSS02_27360 [Planctomycetes bacterium]|nr:hypothetical protein [Planctomycetota bacterium]
MKLLAEDIDALERHIDTYGSISVKQPDVWGQARLSKIREEFETQMASDLTNFKPTLQGSFFAADQAYFANALALSMAASGTQQVVRPGARAVQSTTNVNTSQTAAASDGTPISPPALPNMGDVSNTFGAFGSMNRNSANLPSAIGFGANAAIALEPTVVLEQKARYLNALHELRRINEGDDTADAPGYSLNLVRLPVSVLPGQKTGIGYGAEVTFTITPYLSDELLPTTFRNLVLNDVVDQIGYPVTQFINNPANNVYFNEESAFDLSSLLEFIDSYTIEEITTNDELTLLLQGFYNTPSLQGLFKRTEWSWVGQVLELKNAHELQVRKLKEDSAREALEQRREQLQHERDNLQQQRDGLQNERDNEQERRDKLQLERDTLEQQQSTSTPGEANPLLNATTQRKKSDFLRRPRRIVPISNQNESGLPPRLPPLTESPDDDIVAGQESSRDEIPEPVDSSRMQAIRRLKRYTDRKFESDLRSVRGNFEKAIAGNMVGAGLVPATKSRRARMPFPATDILEIYGYDFMYQILRDSYATLNSERFSRPYTDSTAIYIHLPDVQGFLQEQVTASNNLLAQPNNDVLLNKYCTQELIDAIRSRKSASIRRLRNGFKNDYIARNGDPNAGRTAACAMAWATIVESALLTDQLVRDMRESAAAKGHVIADTGWLDYYSPNPSLEARHAFNEYVRIRWPIHVFALDPVQERQAIAASFSGRREMQLALSLAFVNGQISAQNMMRFARRIEFDAQTIDLNGTTVGFSGGNETFGWRLYPRFQTPEIQSNARVFFQDLLVGGPNRNQLLKQRRLEPGIRECDAIVVMPSFVPYATLESSTNWFKLTNPKHKELDSATAMRLSRRAKCIEKCATRVVDSECYRDGDLDRLCNKARQLESRLPFQTLNVQVPHENTLGGFAMFNTGITDLAPELTGWYGAPVINTKSATTLFLVGNHFSVLQTQVIAGGNLVTNKQMLSRQVIQVTIPANPILVGDDRQKFVDVHLATPYGITQHLLIPATAGAAATNLATQWKSSAIALGFIYGGVGIIPPRDTSDPKAKPSSLLITSTEVDPKVYDTVSVSLKVDSNLNPLTNPITIKNCKFDGKQAYVVPGDALATQVLASLAASFGPESYPPSSFTAETTVTFSSSAMQGPDLQKTCDKLTITWIEAPAK